MTRKELDAYFDKHLPPPIAERAKRNFDERFFANNQDYVDGNPTAQAVNIAFRWHGTPEGNSFWSRVYDTACGYYHEYPSVKGLP